MRFVTNRRTVDLKGLLHVAAPDARPLRPVIAGHGGDTSQTKPDHAVWRLRIIALVPVVGTALFLLVTAGIDSDWGEVILALLIFGVARLGWGRPHTAGWLLILWAATFAIILVAMGPESTVYWIVSVLWLVGTPLVSGVLLLVDAQRASRRIERQRTPATTAVSQPAMASAADVEVGPAHRSAPSPPFTADGDKHHGGRRIRRWVGASLGVTLGTLAGAALGLWCGIWAGFFVWWIIGSSSDFGLEVFLIVLLVFVIGGAYIGGKGVLRIPRLIKRVRRVLTR